MVKPKLYIDSEVRIQAISVRSAAMIVRFSPRSLGRMGARTRCGVSVMAILLLAWVERAPQRGAQLRASYEWSAAGLPIRGNPDIGENARPMPIATEYGIRPGHNARVARTGCGPPCAANPDWRSHRSSVARRSGRTGPSGARRPEDRGR